MEIEKQVCNVELSMRLLELGVKQDSLFAWYKYIDEAGCEDIYCEYRIHQASRDAQSTYEDGYAKTPTKICAAHTVAELERELLTIANECDFMINFSPIGGVWGNETFDEMYEATLICYRDEELSIMERAGTGADVRAKLIIYLRKNNLIEAEEDAQ